MNLLRALKTIILSDPDGAAVRRGRHPEEDGEHCAAHCGATA
jgi:hypothetical protein